MNGKLRLYGEAALVVAATTGLIAAPILVAPAIHQDPAGLLLIGFLAFMAGAGVAVGPLALVVIRDDLRRLP